MTKPAQRVSPTRAMFYSAATMALMSRGPLVTFATEEDGGAAPEPAAEAPADAPEGQEGAAAAAPPEGAAEGQEGAAAPEGQTDPEQPPAAKKSPVAQLQGRVGHLTKTLHERDEAIRAKDVELEGYKALLAAQGKLPAADGAPAAPATTAAPANPAPGTPEFQKLVREEAARLASQSAFDAECNQIYEAGKSNHAETWDESVGALNAMGYMTPALVEAAIASGDGAKVLNTLGQDLDAAERISKLPPIRMAAELTRMAGATAPRGAPASRAPAPIKPVSGVATAAEPDLATVAKTDDMSAYVAARKKAGSPWAR